LLFLGCHSTCSENIFDGKYVIFKFNDLENPDNSYTIEPFGRNFVVFEKDSVFFNMSPSNPDQRGYWTIEKEKLIINFTPSDQVIIFSYSTNEENCIIIITDEGEKYSLELEKQN
jgi:hypothetical protein